MVKYIAAMLVVISWAPFLVYAQEKEVDKLKEPATKLEAFLAKKGKLVIKDSYELGEIRKVGMVKLDALVIYEPGNLSSKMRGIRVEVKEVSRLERSNTSLLDMDEVADLSQAITYMLDLAAKWKDSDRKVYTEVVFSSKGDFKVGFYQKELKRGAFISSGHIGSVSAFCDVEDLPQLKQIVEKGLTVLKEK